MRNDVNGYQYNQHTSHAFAEGRVLVRCYGKPRDWRINDWDDKRSFLPVIQEVESLGLGISGIYIPRPTRFNTHVARYSELRQGFVKGDMAVWTGVFADGVEMPPQRCAIWIPSADCPTIVAYSKSGTIVAAHAERDCLIDRARIEGKKSARKYESVVDAILWHFSGQKRSDLNVFVCCGIGPNAFLHPFNDKKFGKQNERMVTDIVRRYGDNVIAGKIEDGQINLFDLILKQFVNHCVPARNIEHDGVDTATHPGWWSHRNGEQGRNGVLVIKNY